MTLGGTVDSAAKRACSLWHTSSRLIEISLLLIQKKSGAPLVYRIIIFEQRNVSSNVYQFFSFNFMNALLFILFSRLKQINKLSLLNNNIIHRGTGSRRSAHAQRRRGDSCAGRDRRSRAANLISMLECDVVVALVDEESPNKPRKNN